MHHGPPFSPLSPAPLPSLLSLLHNTTPQARKNIAKKWGSPLHDPDSLEHVLIHNYQDILLRLKNTTFSPETSNLLIDMVQDFGFPILLSHNDTKARKTLVSWGLIYPAPRNTNDPRSHAQNAWILPTEIAVLYATTLPIHRPRLHLLLGRLDEEQRNTIARTLAHTPNPNPILATRALAEALTDPQRLRKTLDNPDFFEHLFTLQLLFEWQGICYEQELFSFAWGNDTLIPFTQRNHQRRERSIQSALFDHGFLYALPIEPSGHEETPDEETPDEETPNEHTDHPRTMNLMVLPEELRGAVWDINRENSEDLLHETLSELGGWSPQLAQQHTVLQHEPIDRLKAFACVLDSDPPPFSKDTLFDPIYVASLERLEGTIKHIVPPWQSLLESGACVGLFLAPKERRLRKPKPLRLSAEAPKLLDPGPQAWSRTLLNAWVQGHAIGRVDHAQNNAFGLSQTWINALRPTLSSLFQQIPPLETWWFWLHQPDQIPQGAPSILKRPIPSWIRIDGFDDTDPEKGPETGCGTPPREKQSRDELWQQALLVETIYTLFRLLTLDLLAGLETTQPIQVESFSKLLQDTASLAVHLTLSVFIVDLDNQTYVPVHAPTLLVEPSQDETFEDLAHTLIDHLFACAGVVQRIDAHHFKTLPSRIFADTPPWFSKRARQHTLASLLKKETEDLDAFFARKRSSLRSVVRPVQSSHAERVWLGHPLHTLRNLTKGHTVQSIADGYMDITPQHPTQQ